MSVDSPPVAEPMSESEQRGYVIFATWIIAGLFLDGWSHQVNKPESFFTPWHGLMYSGFGAAVLWGISLGRHGDAESVNDRLTALGVVIFAVGMVGDFGWHELFGIEVDVEALLSPTHLLLMTGGLLLASAPARADLQWARAHHAKPTASFGVVGSTIATLAVVAFFLQFVSAFRGEEVVDYVRLEGMDVWAEINAIRGVAAILLTNLLLAGAATFLVANWRTRPGHLTALLGVVAVASSALTSFDQPLLPIAAIAAGAAADFAVARGRASWVPVVIPAVLWPVWTVVLAATVTFGWSQNVWGGAIFLAVMSGFGIKVIADGSFRAA